MELKAKRVTAMTVLPDLSEWVARYQALKFERVPGEGDDIIGFLANKTGVMAVTTAFLAREIGDDLARRLEGLTIPYIYVEEVDASCAALPAGAEVLSDFTLPGGTREMLVKDATGYMILADTRAR